MIDQLISNPQIKMLEQTLNFTEQRHQLILGNIANISTPGYVQKDVSVQDFQRAMQAAVEQRQRTGNNSSSPEDTATVAFEPDGSNVALKPQPVVRNTPFHDRGVRSIEDLMGQMADNAMAHNTVAQLLKGRYDMLAKAISMKA